MGYRSKVAIRTTPKGLEEIERVWNESSEVKLTESCSDIYTRGEVSTIGWSEIKWDTHYPEVHAVDALLGSDDFREPFAFVRIGESLDDVEEVYSPADVEKGGPYWLGAYGYIEDINFIPILPDFNLNEFTMLVMSFYDRALEKDGEFADRMRRNNALLNDMVCEYEKQVKEAEDERRN